MAGTSPALTSTFSIREVYKSFPAGAHCTLRENNHALMGLPAGMGQGLDLPLAVLVLVF